MSDATEPEGVPDKLLTPLTLGVLVDQLNAAGAPARDAKVFLSLGSKVLALSCASFGVLGNGKFTIMPRPLIVEFSLHDSDSSGTVASDTSPASSPSASSSP